MIKANLKFGDIEIEKSAFHKSKDLIDIDKVDFEKTMISNKISYGEKGFKYFTGYKYGNKIKPLCIKLTKMS